MKNIYIACMAVVLCLCSCSKFDEMSKNPYALYDAPAESYVQPILYNTEYALVQRARDVIAEIMQYSVNRNTEVSSQMNYNYSITESIVASIWQSLYIQAGNAQMMLETAMKEDNPAMIGVALVLRTMLMANITDAYGNVPYFDACRLPLDGEIVYTTTYDSQEAIYADMLRCLEEANKAFMAADDFSARCDYMYNGDVEKWRRFGNTLYLRLLMRCSLKAEENGGSMNLGEGYNIIIREKIAEIYYCYKTGAGDYPVMRDRSDAALVGFSKTDSALYTPFYSITSGIWNSYVACKTLTDELYEKGSHEDPRWNYYFTKAYGVEPQLPFGELDAIVSDPNSNLGNYPRGAGNQVGNLKEADHYALMNFSEMLFIFAEAGMREWLGQKSPDNFPDAKKLYLAAVSEAVMEWNPTIPENWETVLEETEDGKLVPNVLKTFIDVLDSQINADNALKEIMTQKWVSTFWVGIESWCDYRRTGYPILKTNGPAAENNGILPTRFRYPADEKYRNEKSYAAALADWLGGENNMQTDVWWADTEESRETRKEGLK